MKRFGVAGVWLVAFGLALQAQDAGEAAAVKKLVQDLGTATLKGDYAKVVDSTYEGLIKEMGGREQAIKTIEKLMQMLKDQGIALKTYKVSDPGEFMAEGGTTFVIIPTVVEWTIPDGKAITKSYMLGISADGGKAWKFADGDGLDNKEHRDKVLPKLPAKLKLLAKEKPEIIKDK